MYYVEHPILDAMSPGTTSGSCATSITIIDYFVTLSTMLS